MKKILTFLLVSIGIILSISGCTKTESVSSGFASTADKDLKITVGNEGESGFVIDESHDFLPVYDKIADYLWKEIRDTYSSYYQVLGFKISDYKETTEDRTTLAVLNLTVFHKNYDKDPDTVEYIKEAKENNDPYYQTYYDEYLETKEMNMMLKVIIDDEITLYTDDDPTAGEKWTEFKMSDTILN